MNNNPDAETKKASVSEIRARFEQKIREGQEQKGKKLTGSGKKGENEPKSTTNRKDTAETLIGTLKTEFSEPNEQKSPIKTSNSDSPFTKERSTSEIIHQFEQRAQDAKNKEQFPLTKKPRAKREPKQHLEGQNVEKDEDNDSEYSEEEVQSPEKIKADIGGKIKGFEEIISQNQHNRMKDGKHGNENERSSKHIDFQHEDYHKTIAENQAGLKYPEQKSKEQQQWDTVRRKPRKKMTEEGVEVNDGFEEEEESPEPRGQENASMENGDEVNRDASAPHHQEELANKAVMNELHENNEHIANVNVTEKRIDWQKSLEEGHSASNVGEFGLRKSEEQKKQERIEKEDQENDEVDPVIQRVDDTRETETQQIEHTIEEEKMNILGNEHLNDNLQHAKEGKVDSQLVDVEKHDEAQIESKEVEAQHHREAVGQELDGDAHLSGTVKYAHVTNEVGHKNEIPHNSSDVAQGDSKQLSQQAALQHNQIHSSELGLDLHSETLNHEQVEQKNLEEESHNNVENNLSRKNSSHATHNAHSDAQGIEESKEHHKDDVIESQQPHEGQVDHKFSDHKSQNEDLGQNDDHNENTGGNEESEGQAHGNTEQKVDNETISQKHVNETVVQNKEDKGDVSTNEHTAPYGHTVESSSNHNEAPASHPIKNESTEHNHQSENIIEHEETKENLNEEHRDETKTQQQGVEMGEKDAVNQQEIETSHHPHSNENETQKEEHEHIKQENVDENPNLHEESKEHSNQELNHEHSVYHRVKNSSPESEREQIGQHDHVVELSSDHYETHSLGLKDESLDHNQKKGDVIHHEEIRENLNQKHEGEAKIQHENLGDLKQGEQNKNIFHHDDSQVGKEEQKNHQIEQRTDMRSEIGHKEVIQQHGLGYSHQEQGEEIIAQKENNKHTKQENVYESVSHHEEAKASSNQGSTQERGVHNVGVERLNQEHESILQHDSTPGSNPDHEKVTQPEETKQNLNQEHEGETQTQQDDSEALKQREQNQHPALHENSQERVKEKHKNNQLELSADVNSEVDYKETNKQQEIETSYQEQSNENEAQKEENEHLKQENADKKIVLHEDFKEEVDQESKMEHGVHQRGFENSNPESEKEKITQHDHVAPSNPNHNDMHISHPEKDRSLDQTEEVIQHEEIKESVNQEQESETQTQQEDSETLRKEEQNRNTALHVHPKEEVNEDHHIHDHNQHTENISNQNYNSETTEQKEIENSHQDQGEENIAQVEDDEHKKREHANESMEHHGKFENLNPETETESRELHDHATASDPGHNDKHFSDPKKDESLTQEHQHEKVIQPEETKDNLNQEHEGETQTQQDDSEALKQREQNQHPALHEDSQERVKEDHKNNQLELSVDVNSEVGDKETAEQQKIGTSQQENIKENEAPKEEDEHLKQENVNENTSYHEESKAEIHGLKPEHAVRHGEFEDSNQEKEHEKESISQHDHATGSNPHHDETHSLQSEKNKSLIQEDQSKKFVQIDETKEKLNQEQLSDKKAQQDNSEEVRQEDKHENVAQHKDTKETEDDIHLQTQNAQPVGVKNENDDIETVEWQEIKSHHQEHNNHENLAQEEENELMKQENMNESTDHHEEAKDNLTQAPNQDHVAQLEDGNASIHNHHEQNALQNEIHSHKHSHHDHQNEFATHHGHVEHLSHESENEKILQHQHQDAGNLHQTHDNEGPVVERENTEEFMPEQPTESAAQYENMEGPNQGGEFDNMDQSEPVAEVNQDQDHQAVKKKEDDEALNQGHSHELASKHEEAKENFGEESHHKTAIHSKHTEDLTHKSDHMEHFKHENIDTFHHGPRSENVEHNDGDKDPISENKNEAFENQKIKHEHDIQQEKL